MTDFSFLGFPSTCFSTVAIDIAEAGHLVGDFKEAVAKPIVTD